MHVDIHIGNWLNVVYMDERRVEMHKRESREETILIRRGFKGTMMLSSRISTRASQWLLVSTLRKRKRANRCFLYTSINFRPLLNLHFSHYLRFFNGFQIKGNSVVYLLRDCYVSFSKLCKIIKARL